jgi:hypothetical protein
MKMMPVKLMLTGQATASSVLHSSIRQLSHHTLVVVAAFFGETQDL